MKLLSIQFLTNIVNYIKRGPKLRPNIYQAVINLSWISIDKGLRLTIGIIIGAWVVRHLGPSQIGQLNYAAAFISVFTIFATLGLNGVVVRKLIAEPKIAEHTIGNAIMLQVAGSFFAWTVAVLSVFILAPNDNRSTMIVAVLGISYFFKPSEAIKYWFESQLQSKYIVVAEGGTFILSSLLKCALILLGSSLIHFIVLGVIESAISACLLIFLYATKTKKLRLWKFQKNIALNLLQKCWPVILSGCCVSINMSADKIILKNHVTLEKVGIYAAASALITTWYFLPVAIGASIAPRLTSLYLSDKTMYEFYVRRAYILFTVGSALFASFVCYLSTPITLLLYGSVFKEAGNVLSVMIWGIIFVSIVSLRGRLLMIEDNPKGLFILALWGVIANIILLFLLTPTFGLYGAALAFSISWGANAFLFPFFLRSTCSHGFMALGLNIQNEDTK